MAETLDFVLLRGCDYRIRMRLTQPPSPSDVGELNTWTVVFEVRSVRGGTPVLTVPGVLSSLPRAAELGIFDFAVSAANTSALTHDTYFYAIRRTDSGFVDVFSKGRLGAESF